MLVLCPQVCGLINSLKYCGAVLKDWGDQLFFLGLRQGEVMIGDSGDYSLADTESSFAQDTQGTVFDGKTSWTFAYPRVTDFHWTEVVMHYKRLRSEITEKLVEVVVRTFKTLTTSYIGNRYVLYRLKLTFPTIRV